MFVLNIGRFSSQYVNGMNDIVKLAEKIFLLAFYLVCLTNLKGTTFL